MDEDIISKIIPSIWNNEFLLKKVHRTKEEELEFRECIRLGRLMQSVNKEDTTEIDIDIKDEQIGIDDAATVSETVIDIKDEQIDTYEAAVITEAIIDINNEQIKTEENKNIILQTGANYYYPLLMKNNRQIVKNPNISDKKLSKSMKCQVVIYRLTETDRRFTENLSFNENAHKNSEANFTLKKRRWSDVNYNETDTEEYTDICGPPRKKDLVHLKTQDDKNTFCDFDISPLLDNVTSKTGNRKTLCGSEDTNEIVFMEYEDNILIESLVSIQNAEEICKTAFANLTTKFNGEDCSIQYMLDKLNEKIMAIDCTPKSLAVSQPSEEISIGESSRKSSSHQSNEHSDSQSDRDDDINIVEEDLINFRDDSTDIRDDSTDIRNDSTDIRNDSTDIRNDSTDIRNDSSKISPKIDPMDQTKDADCSIQYLLDKLIKKIASDCTLKSVAVSQPSEEICIGESSRKSSSHQPSEHSDSQSDRDDDINIEDDLMDFRDDSTNIRNDSSKIDPMDQTKDADCSIQYLLDKLKQKIVNDDTSKLLEQLRKKIVSSDDTPKSLPVSQPSEHSDSQSDRNDHITKKSRPKKKCELCSKEVYGLSAHLRLHGLPEDEVKVISFSMARKTKMRSESHKSHYRKPQNCPLVGCEQKSAYFRLDHHFRGHHKLLSNSDTYRKFIKAQELIKVKKIPKDKNNFTYSDYSKNVSKIFKRFLMTLNGGNYDQYNSSQYAYKIRQVVNGMDLKDVKDFQSDESISNLEKYIVLYSETHKATSTMTQLSAVLKFMKFIKRFVDECHSTKFEAIKEQITQWRRAYQKGVSAIQGTTKRMDIFAEDINILERSKSFMEAKKILHDIVEKNENVSCRDHSVVRSYLNMQGFIRNSNRPCNILRNLTISEFKNAETFEEARVVSVMEHKTVAEHGPERLVLPNEIYREYEMYISHFRPKNKKSDRLFLTWTGNDMSTTDVLGGIQNLWKNCGLASKLTSSAFRRLVTTIDPGNGTSEQIDSTARHLLNRRLTAEAAYKLQTRGIQSVESSSLIYNSVTTGTAEPSKFVSATASGGSMPTTSKFVSTTINISATASGGSVHQGKGRSFFNTEDRQKIRNMFEPFIKTNKLPRISEIREIISTDKNFKEQLESGSVKVATIKGSILNWINKYNKNK